MAGGGSPWPSLAMAGSPNLEEEREGKEEQKTPKFQICKHLQELHEPISKWNLQWKPSMEPISKSSKKTPNSDLIDSIKLHWSLKKKLEEEREKKGRRKIEFWRRKREKGGGRRRWEEEDDEVACHLISWPATSSKRWQLTATSAEFNRFSRPN